MSKNPKNWWKLLILKKKILITSKRVDEVLSRDVTHDKIHKKSTFFWKHSLFTVKLLFATTVTVKELSNLENEVAISTYNNKNRKENLQTKNYILTVRP